MVSSPLYEGSLQRLTNLKVRVCCRHAVTDFDIVETLKGNLALKTYFVCERNCKLIICYFEEKHEIYTRNLQGQNISFLLKALRRLQQRLLLNKQHLVELPSVEQITGLVLNFQESKPRVKG